MMIINKNYKEMEELEKIFWKYLIWEDKGVQDSELVDDAPPEAVQAFENYKVLAREWIKEYDEAYAPFGQP